MTQNYTEVFGSNAVPPAGQSLVQIALTADTQTYWPEQAAGSYLLADIVEVSASAAYSLILPPANQVSVGRDLLIRNTGAFSVTLLDNALGVVAVLAAGDVKYIYITDNASLAGVWAVFTFGTGTSAADASALAGMGLTVMSGQLAQEYATVASSVSSTVTVSDRASTFVYTSAGSVTCALPLASTAGDGFFINVTNQGTGSVTIDPSSSETIDGELTLALVPYESVTVISTGSGWVTIGYGRSTQFQFTKLVLDITTGSPFTLTSSQASNKLIQFIGTATAPVVVNVPAVVAIYYTECSYSGAFSTTVKTAAGVGVALGSIDRAILYCDGVNVVAAQTASLPAASLSGGVAGAVVYQSAVNTTGFSSAGLTGQLLTSGGTGAPTWTSSPTVTGLTDSGNLTFTGTGNRITGDFSNATVANRVLFQSNVANGNSTLGVIHAGGSATAAQVAVYGSVNPDESSVGALATVGGADVRLQSTKTGSGTYLPMTFYTGGSERMRIDASGAVTGANIQATSGPNGSAFGFRNRIINGNFQVNQRGYVSGAAVGANLYAHDRWKMAASADTYTFTTSLNVTTVTIPAGKVLRQVIEGNNLQSGTHTLSWTGTAQGKIGAGSLSASGVTGTATGGTDLTIEFGPGTVSKVQFEPGSIATPFENRPIQTERSLCQRYCQVFNTSTGFPAAGVAYSATIVGVTLPLSPMRAAPALTDASATGTFLTGANASATWSAPALNNSQTNSTQINLTSSGLTTGYGVAIRAISSGSFVLASEL